MKSLASVKRSLLDPGKFVEYFGEKDSTGILVFCCNDCCVCVDVCAMKTITMMPRIL